MNQCMDWAPQTSSDGICLNSTTIWALWCGCIPFVWLAESNVVSVVGCVCACVLFRLFFKGNFRFVAIAAAIYCGSPKPHNTAPTTANSKFGHFVGHHISYGLAPPRRKRRRDVMCLVGCERCHFGRYSIDYTRRSGAFS